VLKHAGNGSISKINSVSISNANMNSVTMNSVNMNSVNMNSVNMNSVDISAGPSMSVAGSRCERERSNDPNLWHQLTSSPFFRRLFVTAADNFWRPAEPTLVKIPTTIDVPGLPDFSWNNTPKRGNMKTEWP
jgi:hypothetical protein